MCQQLHAIRQSIVAFAAGFDALTLTPAQSGELVAVCAAIEASAASLKALAAARSAEGNTWQNYGYRSPADQLADQAGMSPTSARRALETGRRMADQPDVAKAALAGELSPEQATAVADGVAANPSKARELIDKAKRSSLAELNEEVAKVKAERADLEARRRERHAKRSLRRWTDRDGALDARLYGHPEDGALLWRTIDPIRRRLNILRRQSGTTNETLDALDYDALMTLATIAIGKTAELSFTDLVDLGLFPQTGGTPSVSPATTATTAPDGTSTSGPPGMASPSIGIGSPKGGSPDLFSSLERPVATPRVQPAPAGISPPGTSPPEASPAGTPLAGRTSPAEPGRRPKRLAGSPLRIMIRVDLDALLRGVPIEGELCELAGYGPVPVSVIEELIATENPFIIGILTKGEALTGVYHHGRHPNAYQRSALDFLHPSCAVEGCASRAGLQYDHREDYAQTRITAFDLLDRLCRHHHDLKTHQGWALVAGRGKRSFVPPNDPRHPRHHEPRPGPTGLPPPT